MRKLTSLICTTNKINFGYRDYQINFSDDLEGLDGFADISSGTIQISSYFRDHEGLRETVLHEIFHVLAAMAGLESENDKDEITTSNEAIVLGLSRMFLVFARLNPNWMEALWEEDSEEQIR